MLHKGFVVIQYDNPEVVGPFDTFEDALEAAWSELNEDAFDPEGDFSSLNEWYYDEDGLWIGKLRATPYPMSHQHTSHEIFELLDGAHLVRYDKRNALLLIWFGGHGIHAYDPWWREVSFWNVEGTSTSEDASPASVQESMEKHISGEYEYTIET